MKQHRPLTGVNLGGWLVAEKWLTPSLFPDGVEDEWSLSQTQEGRERLKRHHNTFIDESDFAWLLETGVELVRIPIGYWLLTGEDGYMKSVERLDWAMKMAEKHQLKVMICLHGAKGSQNGSEHSGRQGRAEWHLRPEYQEQTVELLAEVAQRYADSSALWGIELLNEPDRGIPIVTLRHFYREAYHRLRKILRPGVTIVFHDSFRPFEMSGVIRPSRTHPVAMDVHWYAFSSRLPWRVPAFVVSLLQLRHRLLIWQLQARQPVVVGEWSTVLPQAVFDAKPRAKHDGFLAFSARLQQWTYQPALAIAYWNYKAEGRGMWNYRSLVEDGTIQQR